ncbi:MAG: OB-fold-containig protein [Pacificimonas sp.]
MLASENYAFSGALILMILIGLLEAAGLGVDAADIDIDLDADGDADLDAGGVTFLSWLGVGRVPILVFFVVLLTTFALTGLTGQRVLQILTGALAPIWLAGPLAFIAALPLTSWSVAAVARIMPRDETTAISVDELIGRYATVTIGRAAAGSPSRASVTDRHGHVHHVMVEPDSNSDDAHAGERLLLTSREGDLFKGLLDVSTRLPSTSSFV